MTQEIEKRGTLILHKTNPFMLNVQTKSRKKLYRRGNMALINTDTGEVLGDMAGFWEAQEVDASKFVKLYINGVKALAELTSAGTKVFEVLYLKIREAVGQDRVYMSFNQVDQAVTPMSKTTYVRGLHELVTKGFLAASPDIGLFWLNPSFIWNGDRLTFVKEFYKKGSTAHIQLQKRLEAETLREQQEALPVSEPEQPPTGLANN